MLGQGRALVSMLFLSVGERTYLGKRCNWSNMWRETPERWILGVGMMSLCDTTNNVLSTKRVLDFHEGRGGMSL